MAAMEVVVRIQSGLPGATRKSPHHDLCARSLRPISHFSLASHFSTGAQRVDINTTSALTPGHHHHHPPRLHEAVVAPGHKSTSTSSSPFHRACSFLRAARSCCGFGYHHVKCLSSFICSLALSSDLQLQPPGDGTTIFCILASLSHSSLTDLQSPSWTTSTAGLPAQRQQPLPPPTSTTSPSQTKETGHTKAQWSLFPLLGVPPLPLPCKPSQTCHNMQMET